jgi:hypothetical protein
MVDSGNEALVPRIYYKGFAGKMSILHHNHHHNFYHLR